MEALARWLVPRRRMAHVAVVLLTLLLLPGAATVLDPVDLEDYDVESPELDAQHVVRDEFSAADHFIGFIASVRDPAQVSGQSSRLSDGAVDRSTLPGNEQIGAIPEPGSLGGEPLGGVFNLSVLRELDTKLGVLDGHPLGEHALQLFSEVTYQLIEGGYALPALLRPFMNGSTPLTRPSTALDGTPLPPRTNWSDCGALTCLTFDDPGLTQAHIDLAIARLIEAAPADLLRLVSTDRAFAPDPTSPVIGPIGGELDGTGTWRGAFWGAGRWRASSTWVLFRMDRLSLEDSGWTFEWREAARETSVGWTDGHLQVGGYRLVDGTLFAQGPRDTSADCGGRSEEGGLCSVEWAWLDLEAEVRSSDDLLVTLVVAEAVNVEVNRELQQSAALVAIMGVVIAVLLWASLRRWSDVGITLGTLGLSLVWMQGLIGWLSRVGGWTGLELIHRSQFSNLLPILILALGIDDSLHALHRYKQERRAGAAPTEAATTAITRVGRAILLTSLTTIAAFSSNLASDIPALRSFGIEAALGVAAAYALTGLWVPLIRLSLDERRAARDRLSEETAMLHLVPERWLAATTTESARWRWPVLLLALLATGPAIAGLLSLEGDFKVADFMDEEADLTRSVTIINDRFPDEGEPASILVEGDIADPTVYAALREVRRNMATAADDVDDRISRKPGAVADVWAIDAIVELAVGALLSDSSVWEPLGWDPNATDHGVNCTDGQHGLPDLSSRGCLIALYGLVHTHGVPGTAGQDTFPDEVVRTYLQPLDELDPDEPWQTIDGDEPRWGRARIRFGLRQPEDFPAMEPALAELQRDLAPLANLSDGDVRTRAELTGAFEPDAPPVTWAVATDDPVTRYIAATSMQRQLQVSLVLGTVLCTVVLWWGFRSLRQALVTLGPILLVVIWLYGLIAAAGSSINIVTVAIAAMSLGVGIDYCIHVTERFREEREQGADTRTALTAVGGASGIALVGSAASDATGFLVIAQADMGLFQLFGLFSALMIMLSLIASLVLTPAALAFLTGPDPPSPPGILPTALADDDEAA